ncbi:NUDIX hydrolase [Geovibrio thiophilus]|uniref:NUDIX hydrolase n=1 Tax=Geovibrio thiophilus TaxID=139438 RepID=UPI0013E39BAB|nr:CoA pyrophosphatase [Geovibrio thiophilus]
MSEDIKEALAGYKRRTLPATSVKAAVLVPVIIGGCGAEILFTKRPVMLNAHGGEVSFPGGVCEPEDANLEETALRETFEEVGIKREQISIIGALDDQLSKAGFRVTPFVGLISRPFNMTVSPDEVDRVYKVPVAYFTDTRTSWTERWVRQGEVRTVYFHRYDDDIIWGLTAKFVDNFLRCIKALDI